MSRRERLLEKIRLNGQGPKRALGQNFLISDHVIDRILSYASEGKPTSLIEIGPGLGALTEGLVEIADRSKIPFQVIELDSSFAENWREAGLKVTEDDALQVDWSSLELLPGSCLISNLPYQISSSLVIDRSVAPHGLTSMILMFQKEVAKRIAARPGTEDFGLLTVIAQMGWTVDTVCDAGPGDFFPPPRIASRVLRFQRRADAPGEQEFAEFLRFSKAAYAHRRKLIVKNLSSLNWTKGVDGRYLPLERAKIELMIEGLGFSKTARAEEFSADQLLELARRLRA